MNTTNKLLDRYAELEGLRSDYAIAKSLGVSRQVVSSYRTGRTQMDSTTAMVIADRIGADHLEVLARIEIERAPTERVKTVWGRHVGRLLLAIVAAIAINFGSPLILQKSNYTQVFAAEITAEYTLSAIVALILGVALSMTFSSGAARVNPTRKGYRHATNQRSKARPTGHAAQACG